VAPFKDAAAISEPVPEPVAVNPVAPSAMVSSISTATPSDMGDISPEAPGGNASLADGTAPFTEPIMVDAAMPGDSSASSESVVPEVVPTAAIVFSLQSGSWAGDMEMVLPQGSASTIKHLVAHAPVPDSDAVNHEMGQSDASVLPPANTSNDAVLSPGAVGDEMEVQQPVASAAQTVQSDACAQSIADSISSLQETAAVSLEPNSSSQLDNCTVVTNSQLTADDINAAAGDSSRISSSGLAKMADLSSELAVSAAAADGNLLALATATDQTASVTKSDADAVMSSSAAAEPLGAAAEEPLQTHNLINAHHQELQDAHSTNAQPTLLSPGVSANMPTANANMLGELLRQASSARDSSQELVTQPQALPASVSPAKDRRVSAADAAAPPAIPSAICGDVDDENDETLDSPGDVDDENDKTLDSPGDVDDENDETLDSPGDVDDENDETLDSPDETLDSPDETLDSPGSATHVSLPQAEPRSQAPSSAAAPASKAEEESGEHTTR